MQKSVLIVGYGNIGYYLSTELSKLKPDIYDKYKTEFNTKRPIKYDFAFICVDTPRIDANTPCDISAVKDAIQENDAKIYVLKSTVLQEQLKTIIEDGAKEGKTIIFSPEFYGTTQHCNNFGLDFTIIGGEKEACYELQQLLQEVYDGNHKFAVTDPITACTVKYVDNMWIGWKLAYVFQVYDLCNKLGIHYEELRELWLLDKRVSRSMTYAYKDHDYWDSHCTSKDIPAEAETYKDVLPLVLDMIRYNFERKDKKTEK